MLSFKYGMLPGLMLFFSFSIFGQGKRIVDSINFYGSLPIQLAIFDKKVELQENAPLLGTELFRVLPKGWSVKAKLEFGLHLINGTNFNNSANTTAEFLANPLKKKEVFSSRLAYFGIGHEKWGSITIGKQWGAYYDIGAYTDNFSLFGGSANGIYAGGTDGGWKGTGRADNAVVYRNNLGPVELALQSQLMGEEHSYGMSVQYHSKFGLNIGAAYNDAAVVDPVNKYVVEIGNRTTNFITGVNYRKGAFSGAFTFSMNDDAIVVVDTGKAVSFPTYGYELSMHYAPNARWSFEGGFNLVQEREDRTVFKGNYHLFHLIMGANYFITPNTKFYLMTRFTNSDNTEFVDNVNAFVFGFKYDFNFGWSKH
nr:porin [Flavihumibacter fluvii]